MRIAAMYSRVDVDTGWARQDVEELANQESLKIIQFNEYNLPGSDLLQLLNKHLFSVRPDVTFRIYGFHLSACDLSLLTYMDNVHKLTIDCMTSAEHMETVTLLPSIKELTIDIHELESFSFLEKLPAALSALSLGSTKSKKPDLSVIERFTGLTRLSIVGQHKNIECISKLKQLKVLHLLSITLKDVSFIAKLEALQKLSISFGGLSNLSGLKDMKQLKVLWLLRVRGLSDLSVLASLHGLHYLEIEDQPHVQELPSIEKLTALHRIHMNNVGLEKVQFLNTSPSLKELTVFNAKTLEPAKFEDVLRLSSLEKIAVDFMNKQKNSRFEQMLEEHALKMDQYWYRNNPYANKYEE